MPRILPYEEIRVKTVMLLIPNISYTTARSRIALCRDAMGKARPKVLTVGEFCRYYDITIPPHRQ